MAVKKLLSPERVCSLLSIHPDDFAAVAAELPPPIEVGGELRYRPEDLAAWIETRPTVSPPAAPRVSAVARFVAAEFVRFPDTLILCEALYDAYNTWCVDNGVRPKNASHFGRALRRMGVEKRRARLDGVRDYVYVGLKRM